MKGTTPQLLERALKEATVHEETQGTRIEFDTESFYLTAEYNETKPFSYDSFDLEDNKVTLTPEQMEQVKKFVYSLHESRIKQEEEFKTQFTIEDH